MERGIRIGTGGVADGGQMNSTAVAAAARPLFTVSQWQELELQARIFKHLATGEAVPIHLVDHFRKSLEFMASRYYHHPAAAAAAACKLAPKFFLCFFWGDLFSLFCEVGLESFDLLISLSSLRWFCLEFS